MHIIKDIFKAENTYMEAAIRAGISPIHLTVVTAVKRILTDACRKQHIVTFIKEDNQAIRPQADMSST